MVWYVALIAILNLMLGYALAIYLGTGLRRQKLPAADQAASEELEPSDHWVDSDDQGQMDSVGIEEPAAMPAENAFLPLGAAVPAGDIDPATGFSTRDFVQQRLTDMTVAHADLQPMTVALVELDLTAGGAEAMADRLLAGVADTVREMLTEVHTAGRFSEQQFLLLLPADDLQQATKRAEQVRQRVATTQYVADGQEFQTTVTCAVTPVTADQTASQLLEFLTETLDEAKRYGRNRTFLHDGSSPSPIVPPELNFAQQTCAI